MMNPIKQLKSAKAAVKKRLLSIPYVSTEEKFFSRVYIQEGGKTYSLVRCPDCHEVFRCNERILPDQCPGCGKDIHAHCYRTFDLFEYEKEYRIRTSCGDSTTCHPQVLAVAGYDVRTEQVDLVHLGARSILTELDMTPKKAEEYASNNDPRLWERGKYEETTVLNFCKWVLASPHQVRISEQSDKSKSSVLKSDEAENLFPVSGGWFPEVLGDPILLETMRRHHYPVDEGPEALLRFLAARADGQKKRLSKSERDRQKETKEEKKRMKEMALRSAERQISLNLSTSTSAPTDVFSELLEDGTLLIHFRSWIIRIDTGNQIQRKPAEYLVCSLGKFSYQVFDILACRDSKQAALSPSAVLRQFPHAYFQYDDLSGESGRLWKLSNASWLPLAEISEAQEKRLDGTILKMIFPFDRNDDLFALLDDLYRYPALAKLAKAGFPKTLLKNRNYLTTWIDERTSVAEMLNVKESILPSLPVSKCDEDSRYLETYALLFDVYEGVEDEAEAVTDCLYKGVSPSWIKDPSSMRAFDAKSATFYLQNRDPRLYAQYVTLLGQLKLTPSTKEEWFPDDLAKAHASAFLLWEKSAAGTESAGSIPSNPLIVEGAFLSKDTFDGVKIQPCWKIEDCAMDLIRVPSELYGAELNWFPVLPVLKATQDGETIGLAHMMPETVYGGLAIGFFLGDKISQNSACVNAFRKYADKYNLEAKISEI